MLKVSIRGEDKPTDRELKLYLKEEYGQVYLVGDTEKGISRYIAAISENGLLLIDGIRALGIAMDVEGRIKVIG